MGDDAAHNNNISRIAKWRRSDRGRAGLRNV